MDKAVKDIIIDMMITNSTKAGDALRFVETKLISLCACAMLFILIDDNVQGGALFTLAEKVAGVQSNLELQRFCADT